MTPDPDASREPAWFFVNVRITEDEARAMFPIDPCTASLATVQTAMFPMLPRTTAELPPIQEIPMHDPYPDCQPRTPIDATTRILGVIFKGNADLNPTARADVSAYRDCSVCGGSGAVRGHWCNGCRGAGRVGR